MFGYQGFGNAVATAPQESYFCPKGGESWCYNPLVMHMRQHYWGVINYGTLDQIRDTFKKSLREAGYVPTSDLQVLITPTGAASAAVHYFQPEVAKIMGGILWEDAKAANASAQLMARLASQPLVLMPKAPAPSPIQMLPIQLPGTAPKPALTLTKIPLMRLPGAAPAAPADLAVARAGEMAPMAVEEEKKIPWMWIGVGAVVLGGVVLIAMRK